MYEHSPGSHLYTIVGGKKATEAYKVEVEWAGVLTRPVLCCLPDIARDRGKQTCILTAVDK